MREFQNTLIERIALADGDAGVFRTVAEMIYRARRDAADPRVAQLAQQLRGRSEIETIRQCYDYVTRTIQYMFDKDIARLLMTLGVKQIRDPERTELLTSPKWTLFSQIQINDVVIPFQWGDCDCMSMAVAALLLAHGIPVRYKVIAWRDKNFSHVYALVFLRQYGVWMPLDPVLKSAGFGWEKGEILRRAEFDV